MKILLVGACGRMGREVSALAPSRGHEVVCGVDLSPAQMPYPVYTSFAGIRENSDVIIDFSSAAGLPLVLGYAKEKRLPLLLAATGYGDEDRACIEAAAKTIPVFQTGNLSLGINLLQSLVRRAAAVLGEEFDIEIVERHHNQKKDAPSGTALMLAKSAEEGSGGKKKLVFGREGRLCPREQGEIGLHAVRGGNIVGEHEVMFAGEDEIVTLSHSARSRKVFAAGALKAASWLIAKPAGKYSMDDLLEELF